jgi:four helix bundle protein
MQIEKCKMKNETKSNNISERLLQFASDVIKLATLLFKTPIGRHIGGQVMRSATSAGANYEEACGAESRADFVHKLQIALKELRETLYWLRLTKRSMLAPETMCDPLLQEAQELTNIIAKSIVTAKKK